MATPENTKKAPIGNGQLEIGRFTHGYEEMEILEQGGGANVTIGSFCSIASGVRVLLDTSPALDRMTAFPFGEIFPEHLGDAGVHIPRQSGGDVVIGNDVWIGANVTLLNGVTIGDGAVISPNATVAGDVGAYEVWAGNPAQLVRKRFDDSVCEKLLELQWWNLPLQLIQEMAPLLTTQPTVELIEGLQSIVNDLVTFSGENAA
ncbi:CatB-related O-acetyltransferase [Leisingera sp. ANG-M1]|uniref:CatB-related O-acetyltransferase n=1 Tax=Leisingera sp. ANG-M1 TaxID=1577895 RepID=UPI00068E1FD1|nr:CatB-related O-acetyltransferase [Leisingera sp. ANG-M1]